MLKAFFVGVILAVCTNAARPLDPAVTQKIKTDLQEAGLMPDILPDFEPTSFMKVQYPEKLVDPGMELRPSEVVEAPHVFFLAPNPDAQYTMIMFDADTAVPLVRHWISTNIPGAKPGSSLRDESPLHLYTPYHGPTPPNDGKLHRYVFSVWEQQAANQTFYPILENPTQHRAFFNLTEFVETNHLSPITATYMRAGYQEGYQGTYASRQQNE